MVWGLCSATLGWMGSVIFWSTELIDPSINKDQVSLRLGDLHMTMAGAGGGPTESILGSQGF